MPRLDIAKQRLIRAARTNDFDFDVRRRGAQQTRRRNATDEVDAGSWPLLNRHYPIGQNVR